MPRPMKNALELLAGMLAVRAYTKFELRGKLIKKERFSRTEIEQALAEMERLGFLSDRKYCEDSVRILQSRGYGPLRIRARLMRKGISGEMLDSAMQSFREENPEEDPNRPALDLLRKKTRILLSENDPRKRRMKALRMLAGRGFSAGTAYAAVDEWTKEVSGEND